MRQLIKHIGRMGALVLLLFLPGCGDRHAGHDPASTLPSHATFETVAARQFVLKDETSRTRGSLVIDTNDVVRVRLGNSHNGGVFVLSIFPDGRAALILRDDRSRNRISMFLADGGRPVLRLHEHANIILTDERGRNRAVLRVPTNGVPELRLYDDRMKITAIAPDSGS